MVILATARGRGAGRARGGGRSGDRVGGGRRGGRSGSSASRRVPHSATTTQAGLAAQGLPGVLAALDAAQGSALAPTAAVPASKSSGGRMVLALSWFPRRGVRRSARGLAPACRRLGYDGLHRVQPASPAPPRRDAGGARPGVDRPDPHRQPAQLVLTHRQRSGLWVRSFQVRRRARPHGTRRAHRLAAGAQRTMPVRQRAQVQAVLRTPQRRGDTCTADGCARRPARTRT